MNSTRLATVIFVSLLVIGALGTAITIASAAEPEVQISSVTISPSDPAPGETISVDITISNLESSTQSIDISDIYIRTSGTTEEHSRVEDVGSLGAGDSQTIRLTASFDSTGEKVLTVHVTVVDENDESYSYQYPLYFTVEEPDEALISFSSTATEVVANVSTQIEITVANSQSEPIRGIRLNLEGSGIVVDSERVKGSIAPGSEATFEYETVFSKPGTHTLTSEVTYINAEGITRTTSESVDITVIKPTVEADIAIQTNGNESSSIEVKVTNFGNTDISEIELWTYADGELVSRTLLSTIEAQSSRTVSLDREDYSEQIRVVAEFRAAGDTHTASLNTSLEELDDDAEVLGEIRLTGIEITQTNTSLTIHGDAANIGATDVKSVILSIEESSSTIPISPSGEFFVGAVDASQFATFELTAAIQSGTTAVPVTISYIVDGERVTTTQQIELESNSVGSTGPVGGAEGSLGGGDFSGSGGQGAVGEGGGAIEPPGGPGGEGGLLPAGILIGLPVREIGIGLGIAILAGIAFLVYRWRSP